MLYNKNIIDKRNEFYMKTVAFCTLGCKVNQYETEVMEELFNKKGYEIKNFNEVCDIYVINTCSVTNTGDKKSRQMINRARKKNPDAIIAVAGCYSQVSENDVKNIPGVNVIIGNTHKEDIVSLVENASKSSQDILVEDIGIKKDYTEMEISTHREKTRAYIKIEDGCNSFCSYCIIPYARGRVRSRDINNIISEVDKLVNEGFSEFILTGIHIASYGLDKGDISLIDVIEKIAKKPKVKRIRLGSIEPRILTEDFVKRMADTKKVCNHFHISLQSGCDETLKRMNRKYLTADYRKSVEYLRKYFENPAIATDIMVGFPGETEDEFLTSLNFMKEINFANAHVFSYSRRKGTVADRMENQVEESIKDIRNKQMSETVCNLKKSYLDMHTGKELEVLFEQRTKDGFFEGTSSEYIKVMVKTDKDLTGQYKTVIVTKNNGDIAYADIKEM